MKGRVREKKEGEETVDFVPQNLEAVYALDISITQIGQQIQQQNEHDGKLQPL